MPEMPRPDGVPRWTPEAWLRFRIFTADDGGKQGRGFSRQGNYFGCPLLAPDGSYWDCRVVYGHQDLTAGIDYEFGIEWLSPDEAPLHFPDGSTVTLGIPYGVIGAGSIHYAAPSQ